MADLLDVKPAERIYSVLHPKTEKEIGLRVTIISMTDPRMKKIRRSITNKQLALQSKNKHFRADDIEENQYELIFGALTGWEFFNPTGNKGDEGYDPDASLTFKGEVPAFNRANVIALLSELEWVTDQLSEAISDEKAFF